MFLKLISSLMSLVCIFRYEREQGRADSIQQAVMEWIAYVLTFAVTICIFSK